MSLPKGLFPCRSPLLHEEPRRCTRLRDLAPLRQETASAIHSTCGATREDHERVTQNQWRGIEPGFGKHIFKRRCPFVEAVHQRLTFVFNAVFLLNLALFRDSEQRSGTLGNVEGKRTPQRAGTLCPVHLHWAQQRTCASHMAVAPTT